MTIPTTTDVLVVGAGPAGLATAITLAAEGVDVTVVDATAEHANTSRAAVVHARTLEVLDRIGVAKPLAELGIHARRFTVRDRDRVLVPVRFDDLPSAYPYTLMVPQHVTEQVLRDRLTELGVRVHRPVRATGLTSYDDHVAVTLDSGETIRAGYVVGADGMHSVVRDLAGLGFDGETLPQSLSLADIRIEDGGLPADEVVLYFSTRGMLVSAPLPDGSYRIVTAVDPAPEDPDVAFVQRLLDERGGRHPRAVVREVVWGSRFRIQERVASSYRAGRVLLAGDAAHTHSPAGGQGMNLGLRDAVALGSALARALGGDDAGLDDYATANRAEALRVVGLAHRLTRLATLPAFIRPLRNLALRLAASRAGFRRTLALQLAGLTDRS
ncbi:MAG TPA: NAD(P)/FAD-dependent oxidoreductase [Kribbellaceae bacterium]|nr:NAD(P)/FAD-dependent oxidoreductase [Kribbellaceae bacterium]